MFTSHQASYYFWSTNLFTFFSTWAKGLEIRDKVIYHLYSKRFKKKMVETSLLVVEAILTFDLFTWIEFDKFLSFWIITEKCFETIFEKTWSGCYKGGLILEGILNWFHCIGNKSFRITFLSRKFEFPAHNSEQLIQIFCSGE